MILSSLTLSLTPVRARRGFKAAEKERNILHSNFETFVFLLLGMCERLHRWEAAEDSICPVTHRFDYQSCASAGPPTSHVLLAAAAAAAALSESMISICCRSAGPRRLRLPLQDPVWALLYRSKPAGCTERLCAPTSGNAR